MMNCCAGNRCIWWQCLQNFYYIGWQISSSKITTIKGFIMWIPDDELLCGKSLYLPTMVTSFKKILQLKIFCNNYGHQKSEQSKGFLCQYPMMNCCAGNHCICQQWSHPFSSSFRNGGFCCSRTQRWFCTENKHRGGAEFCPNSSLFRTYFRTLAI